MNIKKLATKLEKEWSALYGELYVSYGYDSNYEFLYVCTDDLEVQSKIPKEVEGYSVSVRGIPKAL